MALELVTQLLQLSKDPDHRPFMVTNEGCLPGLVMFLDHENRDVVKFAVEAMHNLTLYEPNRDIMSKEPGLLPALHKLNDSEYPLLSPTIQALETKPNGQEPSGLSSLYSEKVGAPKLSTAKTHTFYIKGMNNFTKHKVEETLVGVKGVVSFLIDIHSHKAVVRTMTEPEIVIAAIKQAGLTATYGTNENEPEEQDEPDYLPEGQRPARRGWGWGSVVSKGSAKKQPEPQAEQGQWGWNSVVKAIWG